MKYHKNYLICLSQEGADMIKRVLTLSIPWDESVNSVNLSKITAGTKGIITGKEAHGYRVKLFGTNHPTSARFPSSNSIGWYLADCHIMPGRIMSD
jgi:hypothetical protein